MIKLFGVRQLTLALIVNGMALMAGPGWADELRPVVVDFNKNGCYMDIDRNNAWIIEVRRKSSVYLSIRGAVDEAGSQKPELWKNRIPVLMPLRKGQTQLDIRTAIEFGEYDDEYGVIEGLAPGNYLLTFQPDEMHGLVTKVKLSFDKVKCK